MLWKFIKDILFLSLKLASHETAEAKDKVRENKSNVQFVQKFFISVFPLLIGNSERVWLFSGASLESFSINVQ